MKTLEELRRQEKYTTKVIDRIDDFIADWVRERQKEVASLAVVRAEIAALTAFNPPNRITHSDQLRVGMKIINHFGPSSNKPAFFTTVKGVDTDTLYYEKTVDYTGGQRGLYGANIAAPGEPTIPITEKDNWVERAEEAKIVMPIAHCGVPGCPFCCPENKEPQFCPPIKCGDMVTVRNHEYLTGRTFRFCTWTGNSLMLLFENGGHFFVEPGDVVSHKWINGPCGFTQRLKCKFICPARCPHD